MQHVSIVCCCANFSLDYNPLYREILRVPIPLCIRELDPQNRDASAASALAGLGFLKGVTLGTRASEH